MDDVAALRTWVGEHLVDDDLNTRLEQVTSAAGRAARQIEARDARATDGLVNLARAARRFEQSVADLMAALPVPNAEVDRYISAGLESYKRAAVSIIESCDAADLGAAVAGAAELELGTADLQRAAAAIQQATGQTPDPRNPYS